MPAAERPLGVSGSKSKPRTAASSIQMRSIASAKSSSTRRASSVVFCSICEPHDQCADAGADAKANKGSDDDVAHWRPLSSHADRPLKRRQRVTTLAQSIQNGLPFIGAATSSLAESRPQAAGAVKPQGGLDLLNVAALAVERRPLGAIGKDEDRVGGAGKSGRAAHGVEVVIVVLTLAQMVNDHNGAAPASRDPWRTRSAAAHLIQNRKKIFTSRE